MTQAMSRRKKQLFIVLLVFISLVFVEGILQGVEFAKDRFFKKADKRVVLSPYEGKEWAEAYFEEMNLLGGVTFQPYIGWRRSEFHGQHINISADGIRKTWNPDFTNQDFQKVFVFGGSTIWGTGVRDDYTIPSYLSKTLNETGAWQITNMGETGYCLTQEIISLILLLKRGEIPDIVIFYDGVNDIYAAYQSGIAGFPQNVSDTRERLAEKPTHVEMFQRGLSGILTEDCKIGEAVFKPLEKLFSRGKIKGLEGSEKTEDELSRLSEAIQADYQRNITLVKKLAETYGFHYHFFWQPVVFTLPNPTDEELGYEKWRDEKMVGLYRDVYADMKNQNREEVTNLSALFDAKDHTVYIDFCHLSEEGNEVVAKAMGEVLKRGF